MKNKNIKIKKQTVFVGMSGGVDSSVSALLLKKIGYEVVGVFIRTWHPDFIKCNEEEERLDAMRMCAYLDIPFLTFDFEEEYKKGVADYMIQEYKKGRTPNPDVMCNREIKFGAFMKKSLSMGADFVATGHYAQNKKIDGKFFLQKGFDPTKDQSYFLWTLKSEQLEKIIFPVGNLKKEEVRKIAKKNNLPVADKKDSQGICFLGDIDLKEFLKHYIKEKKGNVLNEKGETVGFHEGATFYTLGERRGFTISKKTPNDMPYYIYDKDIKKNILYVSQNKYFKIFNVKNDPNIVFLENLNFSRIPEKEKKYEAQIRYHGEFLSCKINNLQKDSCEIIFEKPVLISSGQSVVLYDKDIVLGGGVVV